MGSIVFTVALIAAIVGGIGYIIIVSKMSELDERARNFGSDIDSCIWGISHALQLLVECLKKNGTEVPTELEVTPVLALGMSASVQFTTYIDLMSKKEKLLALFEANEQAKKTEEAATALKKLQESETDIIASSLKYNKRANELNSFINLPVISLLASKKGYHERGSFFPRQLNNN